jgi:hypothetical protein
MLRLFNFNTTNMDIWKIFRILSHVTTIILIAMFIRNCNKEEPVEIVRVESSNEEKVIRDTVYITKTVSNTKYTPKYITIKDTVLQPIDTLSVVKDYLITRSYNDTISIDVDNKKIGVVMINDNVSQNMLQSRSIDWTIDIPVSMLTTNNMPVAKGFYHGVDIGFSKTDYLSSVTYSVMYLKGSNAYKLGLGMQSSNEKLQGFISAGLYFKIK